MKKSFFSFLLMLLTVVASNAATRIDGIYYNLDSNTKLAEVTSGSTKYTGDVVIPEMVSYSDGVYFVTAIGSEAFYGCSSLKSVTIPASVTTIDYQAFYNCTSLTSVDIPNSVTSIGEYAFNKCNKLAELTLPNSVEVIGYGAFYGCTSLTSVDIPNSVTSIGSYAFNGCSQLENITLHNSETNIGYAAFNETEWYKNQAVGLVYINKILYNCKGTITGNVNIKEGTETISSFAFYNSGNFNDMTSVTIPNSVKTIGNSAFYCCTGLTSVTFGNSVERIGDYAFMDCTGLTSVEIPNSVTSIGYEAFYWCTGLTSVTFGNSLEEIGDGAFEYCSSLKSVELPSSLTTIGSYGFYNCTNLESVTIPSSITRINPWVFSLCTGLTSVTIPGSVKEIDRYAFYYCTGLKSVDIPGSVTSIGYEAFYGCSALEKVTIGDGIKQIGNYAFAYCKSFMIDMYCYAKEVPTAFKYTFSNAGSIQLHVPAQSLEAYQTTTPWDKCWAYQTDDMDIEKCATPTISFNNGKLTFGCATEGAVFVYDIKMSGSEKVGAGEEVTLAPTCTVSVVATKPGYGNSEEATAELDLSGSGITGDLNADGNVDAADITKLVDKIIKKNQ